MCSQLSLSQARAIKDALARGSAPDAVASPLSRREWFHPPADGSNVRTISYEDVVHDADREHTRWHTADPRWVDHRTNVARALDDWLRAVSVDELAERLDATPAGLDGTPMFTFTPWQRVALVVFVRLPFDAVSTVEVPPDKLAQLAHVTARVPPIRAERCMLQGSFPSVGFIDLPPGCGKTAWSLALALMALSTSRFPELRADYRAAQMHAAVQGDPTFEVARMVVVAATPATYAHFEAVARRLIPVVERDGLCARVELWMGMGARRTVAAAARLDPDVAVVQIVPTSKLMTLLRASPHVAVAVCVADEFVARERGRTLTSPVVKSLVLQATPHTLQQATIGARSALRDFMGGALLSTSSIPRRASLHQYSDARLACDQRALLDLHSLTHLRARVRDDLRALVPRGLSIYFARSARRTVTSAILETQGDLVPVSLPNVVLHAVRDLRPTAESVERFRARVPGNGAIAPEALLLAMAEMEFHGARSSTHDSVVDRLRRRVEEFVASCPICLEARPSARVYGCCGYCVCAACYDVAHARCPFCRVDVPRYLDRRDLPDAERLATAAPSPPPVEVVGATLGETLAANVAPTNEQIVNLAASLRALVAHGRRRLLVVVEKVRVGAHELPMSLDAVGLAERTGVDVVCVDGLLTGTGRGFAAIKRRFDDDDSGAPMALLSYSNPVLLHGTNLDAADGMIVVGNLSDELVTQGLHRLYRPRSSRDNSRPVPLVKIFS